MKIGIVFTGSETEIRHDITISEVGASTLLEAIPKIKSQSPGTEKLSDEQVITGIIEIQLKNYIRSLIQI